MRRVTTINKNCPFPLPHSPCRSDSKISLLAKIPSPLFSSRIVTNRAKLRITRPTDATKRALTHTRAHTPATRARTTRDFWSTFASSKCDSERGFPRLFPHARDSRFSRLATVDWTADHSCHSWYSACFFSVYRKIWAKNALFVFRCGEVYTVHIVEISIKVDIVEIL